MSRPVVDLEKKFRQHDISVIRFRAYLYAVLAGTSDDFTTIKLESCDRIFVSMYLRHGTHSDVPNLGTQTSDFARFNLHMTHSYSLIQSATDDVKLIKLETSDRGSMTKKRPVSLASSH